MIFLIIKRGILFLVLILRDQGRREIAHSGAVFLWKKLNGIS
ncbi:hypothetical protein SDC9_180712 [bioreactor metagenome]|uniref:Uncharacterized protein n=1 Tax=bioreactor metagenome TaxID=1076179 RepID=A0A645H2I7_9ZZZZ